MQIDYDFIKYRFYGADDRYHTVRACPAPLLDDLKDWLALLDRLINESDPELYPDFESLYLHDLQLRSLCREILYINGIDLAWLTIDMIVAFVHHTTDDKGEIQPSLIAQINKFERQKKESSPDSKTVSLTEYATNLLLDLVNTGLAKDLTEAKALALSLPSDELEAAIATQYNRLKTPEQREKERKEKELQETKEKFYKEWQSGEMFKDMGMAMPAK